MTPLRGAARLGPLVLLIGVACRGIGEAPEPEQPASAPVEASPKQELVAPPAADEDAARECGEAGREPTPLPRALAEGLELEGRGVVDPGTKLEIGGVRLDYDLDAWIGTQNHGRRGAALAFLIDAAEAKGGPYGGQHELWPGASFRSMVGPYTIEGKLPPGDVLGPAEVIVHKRLCPEYAVIDRSEPLSLWVSTEGLRLQTYDLHGELLQVGIDGPGPAPRLDLSRLGYRYWLTPRPGGSTRVRIADHWLTVDEVTPGPGTRYDGEWHADGYARAHARVRIEPATRRAREAAVAPVACGGPSPTRSTLPPELLTPPKAGRGVALTPKRSARVGDLEVSYAIEEHNDPRPGPGRREVERFHQLTVLDHRTTPPRHVAFASLAYDTTYIRDGVDLLRIERARAAAERLTVRHLTLACTDAVALARPSAPTYYWLSTIGVAKLLVGDPSAPIHIELHADPRSPSLGASFAEGYLSESLRPEMVGLTFTIGDLLLEIVDFEVGPGTRRVDYGWESDGAISVLHVQVRISPADAS